MAGKGGTGQACAACKFQRRKCAPDCPLAPYFPPDQPKQFLNAHKLFGVSNMLRILKQVSDSQKSDAMKSIIFQANARERDPVHGCLGIMLDLQAKIDYLQKELVKTKNQIYLYDQIYQCRDYCNNYAPQKQQLVNVGAGNQPSSHALPASWMSPCYAFADSPYALTAAAAAAAAGTESLQEFDPNQGINLYVKPNKVFDYEARNSYSDSKDAYESSAESSMKDSQAMDHFADHELKNAAALFTLTNHN